MPSFSLRLGLPEFFDTIENGKNMSLLRVPSRVPFGTPVADNAAREMENDLLPKVLVLDDDINILAAFEDFLDKEQCEMVATSTAEEAIDLLEHDHFDLLITDVRLRANSGVTLFLNARTINPHLPVIVITGYPESIDEQMLKSIGADFLLIKPLELDKLRHAVRACLAKRDFDSTDPGNISSQTRKDHQ